MKIFNILNGIILLIVLLLPNISIPQSDRWVPFYGDYEYDKFYYDNYSLEYKNGGYEISVWIKITYSYKTDAYINNNWSYLLQNWTINCRNKTITISDYVIYYNNGDHLADALYDNQKIVPDTAGEMLYLILCQK